MPNRSLIVFTGPSGVGKGTILHAVCQRNRDLVISTSATTRSPRPGEVEGVHYFFYSRPQFQALIDQGEFLEWAEFAGNLYGTPRIPVFEQLQQGKRVILEIELEGARQVRNSAPDALQIFVLPPSFDELERRIRARGQDSEAAIAQRLARARIEMAAADEFDLCLVNDDLVKAQQTLEEILYSK